MTTRVLARLCALSLLALLGACDYAMMKDPVTSPQTGSSGDTSRFAITIDPPLAVVTVGQRKLFTATVTGNSDLTVVWSIASGPGTVDQNGLYQAPDAITGDSLVAMVQAAAHADSSVRVTARVLVVKAPAGGNGGDGGNGGNGGGSQALCFERDVLPIFTSNCTMSGCHDVSGHREGFIFTSYAGVSRGVVPGDPAASIIYRMITGKGKDGTGGDDDGDDHGGDDDGGDDHGGGDDDNDGDDDIMPPPPQTPLTATQIETIRRWIAEGASGAPCAPTGTQCDTTNITYSGVVSSILQNNCTGCHSGASAMKGVNLSTHAGVQIVAADGRLYRAISHAPGITPMPYDGANPGSKKLQECQILQIKAWVDRGAPNN